MGKAPENAIIIENHDGENSTQPEAPLTRRNIRANAAKAHVKCPAEASGKADVLTEICLTNGADGSDNEDVGEKPLCIGDRVEAKYRGRGRRYYTGVVMAVQLDGSYDVDYDDGDKDCGLSVHFVRRLMPTPDDANHENMQEGDRKKAETGGNKNVSDLGQRPLRVGDRVEAKYRNRGRRYYKGKIAGALPNGFYDITYDDGDKDRGLPASAIRAILAEPPSAIGGHGALAVELTEPLERTSTAEEANRTTPEGGDGFQSGQVVECRYKGCHKGTVTEGDGNHEVGLPPTHIRAVDALPSSGVATAQVSDTGGASRLRGVGPSEADVSHDGTGSGRNWTVAKDPRRESSRSRETNAGGGPVSAPTQEGTPQRWRPRAPFAGRGNRLHRGVVSGVKVVYLYEIEYEDGTRDVNVPCEALRAREGTRGDAIAAGMAVDVLSWQDRFDVK